MPERTATAAEPHASPRAARAAFVMLLLTIGLATALRLYRIADQSAWVDEYQTVGNLDAPDLHTFYSVVQFFYPDNVPLYWTVLYAWGRVVGTSSMPVLRLLSVLLSLACIPWLYLIGRRMFGRNAGLIAALLGAIAPTQIWIGQSPRPTVLVGLLVLVSVYAAIRIAESRQGRWWSVFLAANLLLAWTHLFAVFFVAIELAFLLLYFRRDLRHCLIWIAVQVVLLLSPCVWIWASLSSVPETGDDFYHQIPALKPLIADWIADDALMTADPFAFQGQTWGFLPEGVQRAVVGAHDRLDLALMLFSGACLAVFVFRMVRGRPSAGGHPDTDTWLRQAFILVAALAPVLIHLVLSYVWRPCLLPRYTSYSALPMYIIWGAALAGTSDPLLRRGGLGLLLALYAYQLSLALPAATRTDWLSLKRCLAAEASPNDLIVISGTPRSWEMLRFFMGMDDPRIVPAYAVEAAAEKTIAFLKRPDASASWVVLDPYVFTLPPLRSLEQRITGAGLTYERRDFPGMNGLFAYRIHGVPKEQANADLILGHVDYAAILADLGIASSDAPRYEAARVALLRTVDSEFPRTKLYYTLLAFRLLGEGYDDLGAAAAHRVIAIDPGYALAHLALALAFGESGNATEMGAALRQAIARDRTGACALLEPLLRALYETHNPDAARTCIRQLDVPRMFVPPILYARAGLFPLIGQLELASLAP